MTNFEIQARANSIRPSYKKLTDVKEAGITDYTTIQELAEEFLLSRMKVSSYLKKREIWPVGGVYESKRGHPTLAFDTKAAKEAITKELQSTLLKK